MEPPFLPIDWSAPFDLEERIRNVPQWVTVKGMFFQSLLKEAKAHGKELSWPASYVAYKDYPIEGYLYLSVEVAQALYPDVSLREGLRRLGRKVYPTLLQSMIGRVVFGALGGDVHALMKLVPKGYSISAKVGKVEAVQVTDSFALLRFQEFYGFYDSYHVGVVEGGIIACQKTPEVLLRVLRPGVIEMHCSWR